MRRALSTFLLAALFLAAQPAWAFLFHMGGGSGGGGGGAIVATDTIINTSASTVSGVPYQFGQIFARGDVPGCLTTNTIQVEDHLGTVLTSQLDEVSDWDDGSCRHMVISVFSPSIAASATEQLQIVKVAGSYTPGTDNRTTADITGSHDFQVQLTNVLDHANATVGSGAYTFDANTCIGDGTIETYATGPVRHGVMVACAGLDTAPTTTTLSGSITSGSTSLTVASATGFPTSGNFLVKIDHEYLIVTAGQGTTTWTVTRGAARSTAASHSSAATVTYVGNFYAFLYFDIYTDPTNPNAVYSIGHMPLVMQPWLNITNADFTSYRADYTDVGHADVRNWAASVAITQNSTNIVTGSNTISMPALSDGTVLQRTECVDFSSSGALPTTSPQIVAGQPYWVGITTGTQYKIYTTSAGPSHGTNGVTISNVGSGTLTITRRICHPYRMAWFSTKDDAGHENFTANVSQMTALYPDLTTSEKQYWIKTGLIPPLDTTLTPNALPAQNAGAGVGGVFDTSAYRPVSAIETWNAIGAAGGPPGAAPLPLWDTVAFLRQDQSDWDIVRAAGLGKAHMPWVATLQEATGRVQPLNDGASRFNASCTDSGTGRAYTQLGTAQPTFALNGNHPNGVVVPASGIAGSGLSEGAFDITGGDGMEPSQGHWPLSPYMEYLFFGREWLLDLLYMDGNNSLMVRQVPAVYSSRAKNRQVQLNGTGTIYYAQYPFGADRTTHSLADMAVASAMGSLATHQERAYAADVLQENDCGMTATLAYQNAGQSTLGMWDLDSQGSDGLTTVWGSWGFIWAYAVSRSADWQAIAGRFATREQSVWGELANGWSSFYGSAEYITNFSDPTVPIISAPDNWNGVWKTGFAPTIDHLGFVSPSGSGGSTFAATAASPTVLTVTLSTDFNLSNGDKIKCLGQTYTPAGGSPGSTYTGPPECQPFSAGNAGGGSEWFFVCNESGTGGTVTFNMGVDAGCTTLVGFSASYTNQGYALHPSAAPDATHCVLLSVNCTSWDAKGQYAYHFAEVNWLTSLGLLSPSSATYTNINARVKIPTATFQGNPTFDYSYQAVQ